MAAKDTFTRWALQNLSQLRAEHAALNDAGECPPWDDWLLDRWWHVALTDAGRAVLS